MASKNKADQMDLERLLNGVDPLSTPVQQPQQSTVPPVVPPTMQNAKSSMVDNTSDSELQQEKLFDYDYDAEIKQTKKRARRTVMFMAKHVLKPEYLEDDYIKDKIEQDVDTMTDLYMQLKTNNIMQRCITECVARGNVSARMFEVFGQLSDKIAAINKQILATEGQIRKTYTDLKFELIDRDMDVSQSNENIIAPDKQLLQSTENEDVVVTNTRNLIDVQKERHKREMLERMKNGSEEIKETQYEEVK